MERFDESKFFRMLDGHLDERTARLVAAAAAGSVGGEHVDAIAGASGYSRAELERCAAQLKGRARDARQRLGRNR